jgi:hypothetical protein
VKGSSCGRGIWDVDAALVWVGDGGRVREVNRGLLVFETAIFAGLVRLNFFLISP